jgi:hypothetical protein
MVEVDEPVRALPAREAFKRKHRFRDSTLEYWWDMGWRTQQRVLRALMREHAIEQAVR